MSLSLATNCLVLFWGSGFMSYDLLEDRDLPHWFHILWRVHRIEFIQLEKEVLKFFCRSPGMAAENHRLALLFFFFFSSSVRVNLTNALLKKNLLCLTFKGRVQDVKPRCKTKSAKVISGRFKHKSNDVMTSLFKRAFMHKYKILFSLIDVEPNLADCNNNSYICGCKVSSRLRHKSSYQNHNTHTF